MAKVEKLIITVYYGKVGKRIESEKELSYMKRKKKLNILDAVLSAVGGLLSAGFLWSIYSDWKVIRWDKEKRRKLQEYNRGE